MPVWILLQPRDYLSSFLLYALLAAGVVGIFAANPKLEFEAFTSFNVAGKGPLFPILFVMVACGAISGFHSLVSAGTTAKQLNKETDARPIAYGSMLIEGLLAIIALITAATIAMGSVGVAGSYSSFMAEGGGGPIAVFSHGIGSFVTHLGIKASVGQTFAALAISAFALTTLDTATRLARFMFQEFFEGNRPKTPVSPNRYVSTVPILASVTGVLSSNRYVGTIITVIAAGTLSLTGTKGTLWPLFGAGNQLLASLTLLAVTVWLAKIGKKNNFVKIPMILMFCVSLSALCIMVHKNVTAAAENRSIPLIVISILLLGVGICLPINAWQSLRGKVQPVASRPPGDGPQPPAPQCGC
jgi:carbon starvation protein